MLSAVFDLLFHSLLLVLLATVAFWAIVGVVAADRSGRSRALGALLGAGLPGVGWALALLPRRAQAAPPAPIVTPLVTPAAGQFWTPAPTVELPALAPAAAVDQGIRGRRRTAPASVTVTALGGLAAVLLLAAVFASWLDVQVERTSTFAYAGDTTIFTGGPLTLAVLALAAVVALQRVRPCGTWPVVGALVGSVCAVIGAQLLLFVGASVRVLSFVNVGIDRHAHADPGYGAPLLVVGGSLAVLWSVAALSRVRPGT